MQLIKNTCNVKCPRHFDPAALAGPLALNLHPFPLTCCVSLAFRSSHQEKYTNMRLQFDRRASQGLTMDSWPGKDFGRSILDPVCYKYTQAMLNALTNISLFLFLTYFIYLTATVRASGQNMRLLVTDSGAFSIAPIVP